MSVSPKVSVIVPIYKVQDFIGRCVETLLGQTLQEVEYIFVNDCTPDNSIEVLNEMCCKYPSRRKQITILHHEVNKGLPAARNTGLAVAQGEYIFHCDSDDFVELSMLEKMVEAAEKYNADLVWCDWYLSFETRERYMREPYAATQEDVLKNILSGVMKYNVWNKLIRRSVYESAGVLFPSGYGMGEDMTIIRLLPYVKYVAYCAEALYHYVKTNTEAFTYRISEKHLAALMYNTKLTVDTLSACYGNKYHVELAFFKQNVKLPFLISSSKEDYSIWRSLYPESNAYIWRNKKMSLRTRLLEWFAFRGQFWFIRMHYKLITQYYKQYS